MTNRHGTYYSEIPGQLGEYEDFIALELTLAEAEVRTQDLRPDYQPVTVRLLRTLECDLPLHDPNARPFESQRYAVIITLPEQERLQRRQEKEAQEAKQRRQQVWLEKMRKEPYVTTTWDVLAQLPDGILVRYRVKPHHIPEETWSPWQEALLQGLRGLHRWAIPFPPSALLGVGLGKHKIEQGLLEVEIPQSLESQPE